MYRLHHVAMLLVVVALAVSRQAVAQDVELRIYYSSSAPPTAAQEWLAALGPLNLPSLQIERADALPEPRADRRGDQLRVIGVLSRSGTLSLPGRQFRPTQARQVNGWLRQLQQQAAETSDKAQQDARVAQAAELWRERLSAPLDMATRGQPADQVLETLQRTQQLELRAEPPGGRLDWSGIEPLQDEFQGLSWGTALAILLHFHDRSLIVPLDQRPPASGQSVRLAYARPQGAAQAWPVGRASDRPDRDLVPQLLEFAPIEIRETPLADLLDALQPRLNVPLVLDRPALASRQIDPRQVRVNFPSRRTFYRQVLDSCLSQGLLKSEVREDDGGRPWLWISTRLAADGKTKP